MCAAAYAAIAAAWKGVYEFTQESERWSHVDLSTHQLLSVPIAFLIVFRANVAHDRFWEGALHITHYTQRLTQNIGLLPERLSIPVTDCFVTDTFSLLSPSRNFLTRVVSACSVLSVGFQHDRALVFRHCSPVLGLQGKCTWRGFTVHFE